MDKFKSGFFSKEEGGYVIKNDGLVSSYQYFLLGKKVLVCRSAVRGGFRAPRKRREIFEVAYVYRSRG